MTPGELDTATIQAKLRLVQELLDDLASVGGISAAQLRERRLLLRAVERILTQMVDLAVGINSHVVAATTSRPPTSYRQSFMLAADVGLISADLAERLAPAVGMRNLLVHEYVATDLELVAAAIPRARDEFHRYVTDVATWLRSQPASEI